MRKGNPRSTKDQKNESQSLSELPDDRIDTTEVPEVLDWSEAKRGLFYRHMDRRTTLSPDSESEFSRGQVVSLKSDPSITGAVVEVLPGEGENRVRVFVEGRVQTYFASQLTAAALPDDAFQSLSCEQLHAHLTALQIRHPGLSTLYSLNAARVDFIPYQFRPVLRFIRSDRPRLLIADSVGVGKTIEAGLILRELQARRDIRSVLIICPRPLVTERKWQSEMKRFDERFTHLDGKTLRYCIRETDLEGVWPEQHQKTILPYSLLDEALLYGPGTGDQPEKRSRKGLLGLDPPPHFDLVIVDEAHHIRNQDTYSHEAVRFFCDHAEAAVFLTATPVQLGSHDLFVLLNALRPDLVLDQDSFKHMAEPNPFINQAVDHARAQGPDWMSRAAEALDQAATTDWGRAILKQNLEFKTIRGRLASGSFAADERVQLITDMEALHTFSGIINRTRRRDIGEFTVRKPETVKVAFTPDQKRLHDELIRVQVEIFRRIQPGSPLGLILKFMLQMIRRQAASCLHGLAPFMEDILNRHIHELEWEEADGAEPFPSGEAISAIQQQIQSVIRQAKSLGPHDPKLEALRKVVRDKQRLPNNKIMLFSSFRHTLRYLHKHLLADGVRVGMIHGDTPDEERVALRRRFEKPREAGDGLDLLLFSEVGCEGLDYQFCDCIVNYDLPWNPMRVEQRIGRIDRNGQKSESVAIVNLITPGTVDADIYERCLLRIGVFNGALGGSEEILGEISKEIKSIADNDSLSDEDRQAKLQQLADNKVRLIQEQERLEQGQMELFGIRLPEDQMKKEIAGASSFWLTPVSLRRLVAFYLQDRCGTDQDFILGDKPLKTLRLSQEARNRVLRDFQQLPRQNSAIPRQWETWLKGGDPHLSVTFETGCAAQHAEAAFIMPLHPLVKQAALSFDAGRPVAAILKAQTGEVPAGRYEFAIYQWRFQGIREDVVLKPVGSSEALTPHLGRLLETATDAAAEGQGEDPVSPVWKELDVKHYKLWSQARAGHRQQTQELAAYRRESLSKSHEARMALLREQTGQSSNEKIRRMRRSQIENAEADYARRIQELESAAEKADVIAEPVAYGVLSIEN